MLPCSLVAPAAEVSYSSRNATAGPIRVALTAGNQQARIGTSARIEGTGAKVAAERGLIANRMLSTAREPFAAPIRPHEA
jgi:hypothetical protein